VPKLTFGLRKGQVGRIGVIGGCLEYTGAPHFAAAAALRLGGDLAHIFCAPSAATPIKSYSPDHIVHPYLPEPTERRAIRARVSRVLAWAPAVDALVVGPGLGRAAPTVRFAAELILQLRARPIPIVLDGDALFVVAQNLKLLPIPERFILTPNAGELSNLRKALSLPADAPPWKVARRLGDAKLFVKGEQDVVTDGRVTVPLSRGGSPRRVGGQGDVLAGALGLFAAWAPGDAVAAAAAASEAVKLAAAAAFARKGRSVIASDVLDALAGVIPASWSA
jgi:ATP-dependent NAD(P)H-hydrate dehydratase